MPAKQEIELLGDGIEAISPDKGSFALNMHNKNGAWHVRKGFGQLAEFDTTLMRNIAQSTIVSWAYEKHVGSKLIKTSFGHDQLVSVIHGIFATGGATSETVQLGNYKGGIATEKAVSPAKIYQLHLVSIFDITTGERWEEALYQHTGTNRTLPLYDIHGHYETNLDKDYQTWVQSDADYVWFEHAADCLFFGNKKLGVWYYIPSSFRGTRTNQGDASVFQQLDDHLRFEWSQGRVETCLVKNLAISPGQFKNELPYLESSIFDSVVDMTFLNGTFVYATENELWFSDVGKAGSILSANNAFLSLGEPIKAIQAYRDLIYVFTDSTASIFSPGIAGALVSGSLTQLSNEIGCLSPNAIIKANNQLIWVDKNGVFSTTGSQNVTVISGVIENFFKEYITNPLNNWYTQSGALGTTTNPPSITIKLNPDGIHMAFSEHNNMLLIGMPETNQILVLSDGDNWSLWTTETLVNNIDGDLGEVGIQPSILATNNIENPWIVAGLNKMYVIGGPTTQVWTDTSLDTSASMQIDDDALISSYYILEYGRGGGTDRNIDNEDYRRIIGKWYVQNNANAAHIIPGSLLLDNLRSNGIVYIDRWIHEEPLSNTPAGQGPGQTVYTLPIQLVPPMISQTIPEEASTAYPATDNSYPLHIVNFSFSFWFDNTNWRPVFYTLTPGGLWDQTVVSPVPNERGYASIGYHNRPIVGLPGPTPAVSEVQCYGAGVPDVNGNQIHIRYSAANAVAQIGAPWNHKDSAGGALDTLNLNPDYRNPMLYLKFFYIGSGDVTSMGIVPIPAETNVQGEWVDRGGTIHTPFVVFPNVIYWQEAHNSSPHANDSVAQPVDWAYKSTQVGLDNNINFKARGLTTRIRSHGKSTNPLITGWWAGLYNTLGGSDWKEWTSQTVDIDEANETPVALQRVLDKTTIRNRFNNGSASSTRTFGNNQILWDDGTSDVGNYLVDEQEVNNITTSDNVRGEWISYMAFGHIQDKAEEITMMSLKAIIRPVASGRRKTGH